VRLLLVLAAISAGAALGGWLASGEAAEAVQAPRADDAIVVRLGDRIRVADAPLGCRVVRMRELGGRVVVDCRRAGPLAGTYGTLTTARESALVRFRSKREAKLILVATHGGQVRRCA
jgi:hypothetical protein